MGAAVNLEQRRVPEVGIERDGLREPALHGSPIEAPEPEGVRLGYGDIRHERVLCPRHLAVPASVEVHNVQLESSGGRLIPVHDPIPRRAHREIRDAYLPGHDRVDRPVFEVHPIQSDGALVVSREKYLLRVS